MNVVHQVDTYKALCTKNHLTQNYNFYRVYEKSTNFDLNL